MYHNLSLVWPLCGPGFTAFWILTYISLLLTWTLHGRKARQDHISILLVLAVTFPAIEGLHEAYLVYTYPGNRANLSSWSARSLCAVNKAIFIDHIVTRTNLLVQAAILAPLCALRMHSRRINQLMVPLGALLLGHYATENFLPHKGETLVPMWRDAHGNTVWLRFFPSLVGFFGLEIIVMFLIQHLFFFVPRALWRRNRRIGLGYLEDPPLDLPPRWRSCLYMFKTWNDRLGVGIGGVLLPCFLIWLLVPTIAADYRANLQSIRASHGLKDKLAALRLTLLPSSYYSIWDWQQMSLLVLGLAVLIYAASDIWADRNGSGHIAADLDLKNLESDTKRDC